MKQIDLRTFYEWQNEQFHREVPPEEGHGVQPTIDMLNRITKAHNLLVGAIVDYCKYIGYDGYPIINGHTNTR